MLAKNNTPTFTNFFFFCAASLATVGEQPESGELIMRFPAIGAEKKKKTGREKV